MATDHDQAVTQNHQSQCDQLAMHPTTAYPFISAMRDMQRQIGRSSKAHGFWDGYEGIIDDRYRAIALLALIGTEVTECIETVRNDAHLECVTYEVPPMGHTSQSNQLDEISNTNLADELADVLIRAIDFADQHGIDIGEAVVNKMRKNLIRPPMHGKKA